MSDRSPSPAAKRSPPRSGSRSPPRRSRSRSRSRDRRRSRSRSRSRSNGRDGGASTEGTQNGVALRWNSRGFGFIKPDSGGEDIFCHATSITDGNCLKEGSPVTYTLSFDDRKGKYRAENVTGGITEERDQGGYGGYGGGGSTSSMSPNICLRAADILLSFLCVSCLSAPSSNRSWPLLRTPARRVHSR